MYVSELSLRNWKNFKGATARLTLRTFLIGPNASGKSNLLDALRFLRDVAQEGLKAAVETRGGVSPLRCLAARQSPSIALRTILSDPSGAPHWDYLLEFNQGSDRKPRIKKELVVDLSTKKRLVERPNEDDEKDPLLLTQTALEQIVANRGFRVISEFLQTVSYQHLVPQVVRDPKGFSALPVHNDPFGRDLLIRIWNTDNRHRRAWLKRICSVLESAVPQLEQLDIEMDSQGASHIVGRYGHWRAHSAKQHEGQFSDGTLRLFGMMWAMFDGMGPLLLEEPELSLHPEVVRAIPQLFEQLKEEIAIMRRKRSAPARQMIISTHSEEMLQDEGIGAEEVLRIEPSPEGSLILEASAEDREQIRAGLTVAEVLLPKAGPTTGQLVFDFAL